MSDERLLAEALRAQAAGGVSTPLSTGGPAPSSPPTTPAARTGHAGAADADARPTTRYRPAAASPPRPHPTTPPGPPAGPPPGPGFAPMAGPRPPTPPRAWTGPATPTGGRPVPAPPPGPGAPPPPGGAPRPAGPAPAAGAWTGARIAWWSGVALLGGAAAGALGGVITLLVP